MFRRKNTPLTKQAVLKMDEYQTTKSLGNLLTEYCAERIIWLLSDIDGGKARAEEKRKNVSDTIRGIIDMSLSGLHYDDKKEMLLELLENSRFSKGTGSHKVITQLLEQIMTILGFGVRYSTKKNQRVLTIRK